MVAHTWQVGIYSCFLAGDVGKGEDPVLVRKFVHEVTPSGLEQQLKDAMAEEVRSLARALKHTDVYSLRSGAATVAAEPIEQGRGGGSKGVKPGMGTAAKSLEPGLEDVSSFGDAEAAATSSEVFMSNGIALA